MKHLARLVLLAALGGLGAWLWLTFFPSPQKVIRKHLARLARAASFSSNEGALTRLGYAANLARFFAPDAEINLTVRGHGDRGFADRDELLQAATAARSTVGALSVDFPNIAVDVSPDQQTAVAEVTLAARVSGDPDMIVEELQLTLRKIDGHWLITRVKSVRVFSLRPQPPDALLSPRENCALKANGCSQTASLAHSRRPLQA